MDNLTDGKNQFVVDYNLVVITLLLHYTLTATIMSDSEQDVSVLGKRVRNVRDLSGKQEPVHTPEDEEDQDDVGPMPVEDKNGGIKKKRKGMLCLEEIPFYYQPTH